MKRHRLETKQDSLQQEWNVRYEKLSRLRQDLVIQSGASIKFQLEKEIQDEECEIKKLEERLDEIEQSLNSFNSQISVEITSESQPQQSIDVDVVPLESENVVDYRNLRNLLKEGKWQAADKETLKVMLKASKREMNLNAESFEKFSCKDLQTIDRLWVTASNGHFGFSVQTKIWLECDSPISYDENFRIFSDRVGWHNEKQVIDYNDLKFSLSTSPKGELPGFAYVGVVLEGESMILAGNSSEFGWYSIFYRVKKCRL
jgi:GUN4-like